MISVKNLSKSGKPDNLSKRHDYLYCDSEEFRVIRGAERDPEKAKESGSRQMANPVIQHWERVMHKNVRSSDRIDAGNIISEAGENFTIMQGAKREYSVPKSCVEGFDGGEVYLNISYSDLMNYKVQ